MASAPNNPLQSVRDYERRARDVLPEPMWESLFGDHGAEAWQTNTNNVDGFDALKLRPRVLVDVGRRLTSTTVLGHEISLPVMITASGHHQRVHADGELATARAAASSGTIMVLSTASTYSIEEVAAACAGTRFFQLYVLRDRGLSERLVRRAEDAGYRAIVLTVDTPGASGAPGAAEPLPARGPWNLARESELTPTMEPDRVLRNLREDAAPGQVVSRARLDFDPALSWRDLEWLRRLTPLPLVIKGIQSSEDARLCREHGVNGLVVSNHGGFALPNARATIETLPEVASEAGDVEVYLDGGVRRGTDVLKALALGARAVLIGRAQIWGLAVGGQQGIERVLGILRSELDRAMALCGVSDVAHVNSSLVECPRSTLDFVSALERLAALVDRGLLSRAEYDDAKRVLLRTLE